MNKLFCLLMLSFFSNPSLALKIVNNKGLTTYYADCDGDGWGDPSIATQANTTPPTAGSAVCQGGADPLGWSLQSSDCNDSNPSISPDAIEICDNIDNNCNGITDGSNSIDQIQWCADNDLDLLGTLTNTFTSCYAPSGFVLDCSDCDDSNASIGNECFIPIFMNGFE